MEIDCARRSKWPSAAILDTNPQARPYVSSLFCFDPKTAAQRPRDFQENRPQEHNIRNSGCRKWSTFTAWIVAQPANPGGFVMTASRRLRAQ
jgi:hypothetical protein